MRKILKKLQESAVGVFGNLRIHLKLIVSFSAVFILSVVIVITVFSKSWSLSLRTEAINYSILYIKQLNENFNNYINELDRLSAMCLSDGRVQQILGRDPELLSQSEMLDDNKYIENFLFNIYTLKPDIDKIILIGRNGSLYSEGVNRYSLYNIVPEDYSWYREASETPGKILIYTGLQAGGIYFEDPEDKMVSVVRQIRNLETNKLAGCIRIDIPFDIFESLIKKTGRNSSMKISVIDSAHSVIFDPYDTTKDFDPPLLDEILELMETGTGGGIQAYIMSGDKTIVYNDSEYTGWITLGIISNDILLNATERVRNLTIIIMLITIIVIIMVCSLIALGVTNPLKRLRASMKKVEEGNFDVRVKGLYADEIGDIGRSFNIMVSKIRDLINKEYFLEIKHKEAELRALQSQINPHFLYNTLETLRMKAVVNDDPEVAEMAKRLSKFYRLNIIGDSGIVPVREELTHVRYYMDIQNIRYSNRFLYIEDFDDELLDARILKLTFQPLIENSIFHGLEPKAGKCAVILRGRRVGEKLLVEIIDNGVGISRDRLEELNLSLANSVATDKLGVGIINVHRRIKYYFGEEYGVRLLSQEGEGTKVELTMPLRKSV